MIYILTSNQWLQERIHGLEQRRLSSSLLLHRGLRTAHGRTGGQEQEPHLRLQTAEPPPQSQTELLGNEGE